MDQPGIGWDAIFKGKHNQSNKDVKDDIIYKCPWSSLLRGGLWGGMCGFVKFKLFATFSKPWHRVLRVHILPPPNTFDTLFANTRLQGIWSSDRSVPNQNTIIPSPISTANLFVLDSKAAAETRRGSASKLESALSQLGSFLRNEVAYTYVIGKNVSTTKLTVLASSYMPSYRFPFIIQNTNSEYRAFKKCASDANNLLKADMKGIVLSLGNIFDNALTTAISNFTAYSSDGENLVKLCNNWSGPKQLPNFFSIQKLLNKVSIVQVPNVKFYVAHARIQNKLKGLRFISCGRPDISSLAFQELIVVFHGNVWISLSFAILTLILFFQKTGFRLEFLLVAAKLFLEQGNPFPDKILNNCHVRIVCVLALYAGIVLSNAYKNANVYNMIAPRYPVPYKQFAQLFSDNFSIHQRYIADSIEVSFVEAEISIELLQKMETKNLNISVFEYQKLLKYHKQRGPILLRPPECDKEANESDDCDSYSRLFTDNEFQVNLNMVRKGLVCYYYFAVENLARTFFIRKLSPLKPETGMWSEEYNETKSITDVKRKEIQERSKTPQGYSKIILESLAVSGMEKSENFLSMATRQLLETVKTCNKTAIITSYENCIDFYRQLVQANYTDVYIGTEQHFESNIEFEFHGFWPYYILKRLKLLQGEMGVWRWWERVKGRHLTVDEMSQWRTGTFRPPNMTGNILVLFTLYMVGCCLGCFGFGCETWRFIHASGKLVITVMISLKLKGECLVVKLLFKIRAIKVRVNY